MTDEEQHLIENALECLKTWNDWQVALSKATELKINPAATELIAFASARYTEAARAYEKIHPRAISQAIKEGAAATTADPIWIKRVNTLLDTPPQRD